MRRESWRLLAEAARLRVAAIATTVGDAGLAVPIPDAPLVPERLATYLQLQAQFVVAAVWGDVDDVIVRNLNAVAAEWCSRIEIASRFSITGSRGRPTRRIAANCSSVDGGR